MVAQPRERCTEDETLTCRQTTGKQEHNCEYIGPFTSHSGLTLSHTCTRTLSQSATSNPHFTHCMCVLSTDPNPASPVQPSAQVSLSLPGSQTSAQVSFLYNVQCVFLYDCCLNCAGFIAGHKQKQHSKSSSLFKGSALLLAKKCIF